MSVTITFGWWLVPASLTLVLLTWAFWPDKHPSYGMDIGGVFKVLAAVIVSLAAWLVWSLLS